MISPLSESATLRRRATTPPLILVGPRAGVRFFIAPSLAAEQLAFVGSALFAAKAPRLGFLFAAPLADFAFEVHALVVHDFPPAQTRLQ